MKWRRALLIGSAGLVLCTPALAMPQAIAYALIYIGVSKVVAYLVAYAVTLVATGLYSRRQRRKAIDAYNRSLKDRTVMIRSGIEPRELVLGRVRKSGVVLFVGSTGEDKRKLILVVSLAAHEIDAVETVYFNEVPLTLDPDGTVRTAPYSKDESKGGVKEAKSVGVTLVPGLNSYTDNAANTILTASAVLDLSGDNGTIEFPCTIVGKTISWDAGSYSGVVRLSYQRRVTKSYAKVWWHLGTSSQAADARIMELFPGKWTSAHRLRGIAYLVAELTYDTDVYTNSVPQVSAVIRGAKVLDPRTSSTAWSQNVALLARCYATHQLGANQPASRVSDAHVIAAANACDTVVEYPMADGDESRAMYTAGILALSGARPLDILSELAESMGGKIAYSGNTIVMRAGAYTAPVIDLDDNDFSDATEVQIQPRRPRQDLINTVTGTFVDEDKDYQVVDFAPVSPSVYVSLDGREMPLEIELSAVTHAGQAQHIVGVMLRDARQALTISASFKMRAYPIELFDTVTLSNERYGWNEKEFEVLDRRWSIDGLIKLTLKETHASIFAFDGTFSRTDAAPNTTLPKPWVVADVGPLTLESGTEALQRLPDGTILSRILVTWPDIDDEAVQASGVIEVAYVRADKLPANDQWPYVTVPGSATEAYIPAVEDKRVYLVRARARNTLAAGEWSDQVSHRVVGKTEPPNDVAELTYSLEEFGVRLRWDAVPDLDVAEYELRTGGTTWLNSAPLSGTAPTRVRGTTYLWRVIGAATQTVFIKAVDSSGNLSANAASVTVTIPKPSITGLSASFNGANYRLTWVGLSAGFAIAYYRVRDLDAPGDPVVATPQDTVLDRPAYWGGSRTFGVAAVDGAGNVGTEVTVQLVCTVPGAVTSLRADVTDNNVLLFWAAPATGTLPIAEYEVRRGATWAGGASIGSNGNSTFGTVFEQVLGTYTYWVVARDSAGNEGTPLSVSAFVNQPPDYVLQDDLNSAFGGTFSGTYLDNGSVYGPAFEETWEEHFASRSWTTIDDKLTAGYPLYFQPSADTGYYEEEIDYGTALPATTITVTPTTQVLFGAVTVSVQISYKTLSGDAWTDAPAGATSVLANNFRYVKVRVTFTAAGGDDLIEMSTLNVKLATKRKTGEGRFTANAADASPGTWVAFNTDFLDAQTPSVQFNTTQDLVPIVSYTDAPNPTGFYVMAVKRSDGSRVTVDGSYIVRGI